jgi:endonuclease YncB( thermonuclease family)
MPLWSFPAVVGDVVGSTVFTAELDLGMRLAHPLAVRVAGTRPRNKARLREFVATGQRVVLITGHLGDCREPVACHVALDDGRDLAHLLRGTGRPGAFRADYGAGLDEVWRYPATVLRPGDGDTPRMRINVGVPTRVTAPVRVAHIDCAETGTAQGGHDTVYGAAMLTPGLNVTLTSRELDKYGRVLGDIALPDGRDYATAMLDAGHAKPYEGHGPR